MRSRTAARGSRRRRLQEHHHRAGIQRPPPTDPTPSVIPPASPTAPRAPRPRCTGRANRDHQHLLVGALLTLEPKPINRRPFDTKDLPPYPGCAHTVPCPCGPDLDSQKPYRARCVAQTQPDTSPTKTTQGPEVSTLEPRDPCLSGHPCPSPGGTR